MLVNLYPSWEEILANLADLLGFQWVKVDTTLNNQGKLQNSYTISNMSYVRKADLDDYIKNSTVGASEYARASVLYSLYACHYLTVVDLEYPTYQDWKNKHGLSIDHSLPRYWFPRLTFDCTNWKPMPIKNNQSKGDDFLDEGVERLQWLSTKIMDIKSKYL
ncbi:hypothetical protein NIES593_16210 [Hydrococcus rivularis NIES-593]|uniref:Uncharacterized protein n=1 Tax=Hydrococcus rivularis NIES-593 TaxID=1921803 RepID=A0A1U7HCP3_9CYAN|nr:hypothetical protein [Hydrococcus rivularis]OKH21339.1 hypothetical protein NIES593_16210 [Hydrococcus rivularis NIES-593]